MENESSFHHALTVSSNSDQVQNDKILSKELILYIHRLFGNSIYVASLITYLLIIYDHDKFQMFSLAYTHYLIWCLRYGEAVGLLVFIFRQFRLSMESASTLQFESSSLPLSYPTIPTVLLGTGLPNE